MEDEKEQLQKRIDRMQKKVEPNYHNWCKFVSYFTVFLHNHADRSVVCKSLITSLLNNRLVSFVNS